MRICVVYGLVSIGASVYAEAYYCCHGSVVSPRTFMPEGTGSIPDPYHFSRTFVTGTGRTGPQMYRIKRIDVNNPHNFIKSNGPTHIPAVHIKSFHTVYRKGEDIAAITVKMVCRLFTGT